MNTHTKFKSALYIKALILTTSLSVWAVDAPAVTDFDVTTYFYHTGEGALNDHAGDEVWSPSSSTIIIRNDAGDVIDGNRNPDPAAVLTTADLFVVVNPTGRAYVRTVCVAGTYDAPTGQQAAFVIDPAHPIVGANPQAVRLTSALTAPGGMFEGFRDAAANWGRYVCHYTLNRTIAAAGAVPETNYAWNLFLINTAIPADPAIVEAERIRALPLHERTARALERRDAANQARNDAEAQRNIALAALDQANDAQAHAIDLATAQANHAAYLAQRLPIQTAVNEANRLVGVAQTISDELAQLAALADATEEQVFAHQIAQTSVVDAQMAANQAQDYLNVLEAFLAHTQQAVDAQAHIAAIALPAAAILDTFQRSRSIFIYTQEQADGTIARHNLRPLARQELAYQAPAGRSIADQRADIFEIYVESMGLRGSDFFRTFSLGRLFEMNLPEGTIIVYNNTRYNLRFVEPVDILTYMIRSIEGSNIRSVIEGDTIHFTQTFFNGNTVGYTIRQIP